MKFRKNTVTINDCEVSYWEKHPDKQEAIILLHGFPGNHMGLIDLANNLGREYRLIIPDLPACGKSFPLQQAHTLGHYADWLADFSRALGIKEPIIIGHSFGSRVALVFAAQYPGHIAKLVLITPVVTLNGILPHLASLKGFIAKLLPEYMRKRWLSNKPYQYAVKMIIFKSASKKRRQEITKIDIEESKNLNVNATIEIFDEFYRSDLLPLAKKITAPCLVVAGDKDQVATPASIKKLVSQSDVFSLQMLKKSGHLLPLERPKLTANVIQSWLTNS